MLTHRFGSVELGYIGLALSFSLLRGLRWVGLKTSMMTFCVFNFLLEYLQTVKFIVQYFAEV